MATPTLDEFAVSSREPKPGCLIALSSVAAKEARAELFPYNASKAAVLHLVWSWARVLAPHQIRVHALCPGPVDTDMWRHRAELSPEGAQAARARREAEVPLGRFAEPADVAGTALFLASDDARYLTGLSIDVAGGAHLGMGT